MVSASIMVCKDVKTVWQKIETEFCKAFKCNIDNLINKRITHKTTSYTGSPIEVNQEVIEYNPGESIAINSEKGDDVVTSRYLVETVTDTATRVTLTITSENRKSVLKHWNFKLMSLPVLKSGTKRRIRLQLNGLKTIIENEGG